MFGTINPDKDYPLINDGVDFVQQTITNFTHNGCRIEIPHPHRLWEYGSAVQLALMYEKDFKSKGKIKVLNVGSGWDALGPALALKGMQVLECEPDAGCRKDREQVNATLIKQKYYPIELSDAGVHNLPDKLFDLVYCISVIEHCPDEQNGWRRLAERVKYKGILFITTDVMPRPGKGFTFDHLRVTNYTIDMLRERVEMLEKDYGMQVIGEIDYQYNGSHVFDYSFFRVGLRKVKNLGDNHVSGN